MIVAEINNQIRASFNQRFFKKIISNASRLLKIRKRTLVSVALVNKITSQKLNVAYRRINQPTDVLSFASREVRLPHCQEKNYLGEIIICYPLARKQAKEYKVAVQAELARLLIHGLLHLTGYHHQTDGQRKKIEKLTEKILN